MTSLREIGLEPTDLHSAAAPIEGSPVDDPTVYRFRVPIPDELELGGLRFLSTYLDVPALMVGALEPENRPRVVGALAAAEVLEEVDGKVRELDLDVRFYGLRHPDPAPRFAGFSFRILPDQTPPDMISAPVYQVRRFELAAAHFTTPAEPQPEDPRLLERLGDLAELVSSPGAHTPGAWRRAVTDLAAAALVLTGRATRAEETKGASS